MTEEEEQSIMARIEQEILKRHPRINPERLEVCVSPYHNKFGENMYWVNAFDGDWEVCYAVVQIDSLLDFCKLEFTAYEVNT